MSAGGDSSPLFLLTDNGSIRASSALALRSAAEELATRTGQQEQLGGIPALRLRDHLLSGEVQDGRRVVILPYFLAKGGAIAQLLDKALAEICKERPSLVVHTAPFLFEETGPDQEILARACAARIEELMEPTDTTPPSIILVDHGSPYPIAAQIRNFVAGQVQAFLHDRARCVLPASMERREGTQYDFTAPLLADALRRPELHSNPLILCYFFLLPGRHAGEGGDVADIIAAARQEFPDLDIRATRLLGDHPLILEALTKRIHTACRNG